MLRLGKSAKIPILLKLSKFLFQNITMKGVDLKIWKKVLTAVWYFGDDMVISIFDVIYWNTL